MGKRTAIVLSVAVALICALLVIGSTPMIAKVVERTDRSAGASALTTTLTAPSSGLATAVDVVAVSNTAGGTATNATVSIQKVSDSSVLWEMDVQGGSPAAPALGAILTGAGGLYKGKKDVQLKVVTTMAGATALKVNVKSHEEVANE